MPNILLISVTSLFVKGPKVPAIGELSKQHSRQQKRKEIYAEFIILKNWNILLNNAIVKLLLVLGL